MSKVFIGVGHGGADPGAVANGLKEKDMNLVMALALKEELDRHGVTTAISRTKDEDDPLTEEIKEANAFAPDLAIDCHNNAGGGDGFEALYQTNSYKDKSHAIAQAIEAEVIKLGQNSRGCKTKPNTSGTDYFGFLREIKCPAVICEGVFVDSEDRLIAATVAKQQAFGVAYAKGILKILGIKYITEDDKMDNAEQNIKQEVPQWQIVAFNKLVEKGVIGSPEYWKAKLGDNITVGEAISIIANMI